MTDHLTGAVERILQEQLIDAPHQRLVIAHHHRPPPGPSRQKIPLHRQLADLRVKLTDLDLMILTTTLDAVREHLAKAIDRLALPARSAPSAPLKTCVPCSSRIPPRSGEYTLTTCPIFRGHLRFLNLETSKWQYTHGVRNVEAISPGNWIGDQYLLDRPGNKAIQLQLFYDYGSNPLLYPQWQTYFREHQPPTLVVWGKNDHIFPAEGAHPYKRDLENLEFHLLDTGHFALEEDGDVIAGHIRRFLTTRVPSDAAAR